MKIVFFFVSIALLSNSANAICNSHLSFFELKNTIKNRLIYHKKRDEILKEMFIQKLQNINNTLHASKMYLYINNEQNVFIYDRSCTFYKSQKLFIDWSLKYNSAHNIISKEDPCTKNNVEITNCYDFLRVESQITDLHPAFGVPTVDACRICYKALIDIYYDILLSRY